MRDNFWVKGKQSDWKVMNDKGIAVSESYSSQLYAVGRGQDFINHTRGNLFVENSSGKVIQVRYPKKNERLGFFIK